MPAHAGVTIVSNVNTATLQAAIDAAADGDTLLLDPNSGPVTNPGGFDLIDGKSLTLVARQPTTWLSHLAVRNLAAGQQVILRGLRLETSQGFSPLILDGGVVDVLDCAGTVWLEDCTLIAPPVEVSGFGFSPPAIDGLHVSGSARVIATDCTFLGGRGALGKCDCILCCAPGSAGGEGVSMSASNVALLRCSSTGGPGGGPAPSGFGPKQPSGHGADVEGASFVHAAGGTLTGGAGASFNLGPGAGLHIGDAASFVQLRGTACLTGPGSPPAPDIDAPSGNFTTLSAAPRGLQVTSPVHVDGPGTLHIEALPGDLVALFESPLGGWLPQPGKQGVFLLGAPLIGPVFLAVDTAGDWTIPFVGPHALPPGVLGATALLQLFVKDGSQVLIEDVASCTLLDPSIP